jgi:hypothetical protein
MFVRTALLAGMLCIPFLSGCYTGENRGIDDPPPFRVRNVHRIAYEISWLYADVQDTIFGCDYNDHLQSRYGPGPY